MFAALIITLHMINAALNVLALRQINLRRLQFIDGVILGLTYYVTIPFAVILLYGWVSPMQLPINDYRPYDDYQTTIVVLIGSFVLIGLKLLTNKRRNKFDSLDVRSNSPIPLNNPEYQKYLNKARDGALRYLKLINIILISLYIITSLYSFRVTGVSSGDHWFYATSELMAQSSTFVIVKYISNFSRTAMFGSLAMLAIARPRLYFLVIGTGCALSLIDLFTTFNRITVVYLLVMIIIISWRRVYAVTAGISALLFCGIYASSIWPEFRGQISNYGYSISGMTSALGKAIEVNATSQPFVDRMNGLFESFNFTVLNWIVTNRQEVHVAFGSYFIRPLTVIIPRSLWPSRPDPFSTIIGSHFSNNELAVNSFLFGEPFANSLILWPVLLVIVIIAYDWSFRQLGKKHPVWGAIGAIIALAWWRFDSSFPAICLLLSLTIYFAMALVTADFRPKTSRSAKFQTGTIPR